MDDYQDGRDAEYEWAAHQLMLERERAAIEALNRCAAAGADPEAIRTLARECGLDLKHITIGTDHAKAQ